MTITPDTVRAELITALRHIRIATPGKRFPSDKAAASDIRTGYLDGKPVKRLVVTLRAPGCSWTISGGGCVMCGHHAGTLRGIFPTVGQSVRQFTNEIAKYDLTDIRVLSLYNSGSVLNREELRPEALNQILGIAASIPGIRKVVLESRAEYVDPVRIRELAAILSPQAILSIAIGLETSSDEYRDLCINKGVTLKGIERAVRSLDGIAETQIYILAGIPFLTEQEAIDDAVRSIQWAHGIGAGEIHIEPLTLQRHALVEVLCRNGLYRLPSLHSVYEILRRVTPGITPYVSPFMHMPLPEAIPAGCPVCTDRLVEGLLAKYNLHRDAASLEEPPCSCRAAWKERCSEVDPRPIALRVHETLEQITWEARF